MILGHGQTAVEPTLASALTAWPIEPFVWLFVIGAGWSYLRAARRPPGWPRSRTIHLLLGLGALWLALATPVAVYAESLLWVHMVQHLLVLLVAAPLIALGAPIALALRASSPGWRARLLAVLGSRFGRSISHPALTWTLFAAVLWASHLSGFYNFALETPLVHVVEHLVYLGAAFLFWQPVVGLDPRPGRLSPPARVGYLLAALPMQSFLGLVLYSADRVLYPHYASVARDWGPGPLDDQTAAALIMWLGGDGLMLIALGFALAAWMRHEARVESVSWPRRNPAP
ncbi:MAG: cytochrome c oxidase assembly protein [Actinomycetota bacterium]